MIVAGLSDPRMRIKIEVTAKKLGARFKKQFCDKSRNFLATPIAEKHTLVFGHNLEEIGRCIHRSYR
jgi:hypothetical protein